ncbi:MAG TPA: hypothetical protein VKV05_03045 [Terriglobales bacterium]|nr:hypothetical protein [Terriglobales bacterium]
MIGTTMIHRNTLLIALILAFTVFLHAQTQTQNDTVTLKGTVGETTLLSNNDLHVWLQSGRSGSEVCLGPERFLESQGLVPAVGDSIEVTGVRVGNGSLLVASALEMRGKTLNLRASQGPPASSSGGGPCPGCGCGGYGCGGYGCGGRHCGHCGYGHCCDHE